MVKNGVGSDPVGIPMIWQKIFKVMGKMQFGSKYIAESLIFSCLRLILWSLGSLDQHTQNLKIVTTVCFPPLKIKSINLHKTLKSLSCGYFVYKVEIKGWNRFSFALIDFFVHLIYGIYYRSVKMYDTNGIDCCKEPTM